MSHKVPIDDPSVWHPEYPDEWKQRIVANVRKILQDIQDAGAIESTATIYEDGKPIEVIGHIVPIHNVLTEIEQRAADEPVEPEGTDRPSLPIPVIVTLTDEQKDTAYQVWDDTMPGLFDRDVTGLLEATPYDPDEEEE